MANEGVTSSASSSSAGGQKNAVVKSGVWRKEFEVTPGTTVKDLRKKMSVMASIPDNAQPYSGTTLLDENDVVTEGMNIEFIKKTGEKG